MDGEDECEITQRWKAALYFTLHQFCGSYEDQKTKLHPSIAAALTEVTFKYLQTLSRDLELFAKHGKRSQVNVDDMLLVCRKSDQIRLIRDKADSLLAAKGKETAKKRKKEPPLRAGQELQAAILTMEDTMD